MKAKLRNPSTMSLIPTVAACRFMMVLIMSIVNTQMYLITYMKLKICLCTLKIIPQYGILSHPYASRIYHCASEVVTDIT